MKKSYVMVIGLICMILMVGCFPKEFKEKANEEFGDQHFKTVIALIELHKVRNGNYPDKLDDVEYVGEWDKIAFNSVEYKKLEEGYELNIKNGWVGKPESLSYPKEFWEGLGLKKSNLKEKSN
ncbi:MAG: hypothetical protein N4A57_12585 [Anaeromicrobium sp.]|uniref:hypothetical protein n=1 Tax=Anaeromicrobium sp. TaxID=1929132 RepID=UPI0025FE1213|nr:hypothetical protein [Anaeromicrobium sp.]MCT4595086.1 hypothetical protein [Anaeromicrobium sp.]